MISLLYQCLPPKRWLPCQFFLNMLHRRQVDIITLHKHIKIPISHIHGAQRCIQGVWDTPPHSLCVCAASSCLVTRSISVYQPPRSLIFHLRIPHVDFTNPLHRRVTTNIEGSLHQKSTIIEPHSHRGTPTQTEYGTHVCFTPP